MDRFRTRTHFLGIITDKFFNCRNLTMSYSNYDNTICTDLKVQLRGWHIGIKFVTPSSIGTMGDIKILHEALKTGECTWVAMS